MMYQDGSVREDIQKKNCRFGENGTIGGEGVRKIIEFSSFTNDEKHGRGGSQTYKYFILLFFTLSLGGEGGKVNDAIFTKSAVFFYDVFPRCCLSS